MLQSRTEFEDAYQEDDSTLDLRYYAAILRKRILYLLIPFVLISGAGIAAAMWWPPTYLSEAKILVESQQIPTDLVRPTVTTSAKERIQVIQQRVTTRDNLNVLLDKYKLYADRRDRLSRTELLDLMRENIRIEPIDLEQAAGGRSQIIALKVGFTDPRADIATQVANELVTLFLNEDARNRTNRAVETSRFLAREAQRLETELAAVEAKVVEAKKQFRNNPPADISANYQMSPLAVVKAELAKKRAVYSKSHPQVKQLEAQLAAMEKLELEVPPKGPPAGGQPGGASDEALDALLTQRISVQKNLEVANQKLAAARLGETLERDQFSERLQVLEQAIAPQKPIKPNRPKIAGVALIAAVIAGLGSVLSIETFDKTIRGSRDLVRVAGGNSIVLIPYISTQRELRRSRRRLAIGGAVLVLSFLSALLAVHFFFRPLDELWPLLISKYL